MDLLGQAIISTADYNLNFEEKKQALKRKLERLESMEIDVIKELEGAESRSSKKRKNEVQNWLNNVRRLKNDIGTMELEAGPEFYCQNYWFDLSNEDDLKKRAAKLSKALSEKQEFVLILDDLWNYFPLKEVGILAREKGCKLILTTRMLDVCRQMECQETIKVKSLPEFEAWQLFQDKLGKPLSLDVMEIAKSIASECAGLPLGIITIAASMRGG
ncbi:hypothetical protein GH714_035296 [Hevea brasiliensis]|uniref:NB-ARC domain-containing protein n=1 Tax=Hevea brasiliensis TaxID=3981 RepID=A0A6A6N776_HEVBR|nr:hypothetical protein GH714_035296 [Hevea brasiliensis]